jgi:hypothetical protein
MRGLQPKLTGPSGLGAVTAAGELPVEPEILELFRGWRARATGEFVLESDRTAALTRLRVLPLRADL